MASPIRSSKDFWTGTIYVTIGSGAILIALVEDYGIGTAVKMGPAYFPMLLSSLLILIGLISLVRSFITPGTAIGAFTVKGLLLVLVPIFLFGLLVRKTGLIVVLPMLVIVSSYASREFRWGPVLALAAGLTAFCALVFLKGLGVPLPILGSWLGD
ncbi:MAG: small permease of tripartite tricarboxylate transporter [Syntrophobacteraceae bacterium CG2_30_61_12]|nr:MAG: small permease of tripartite tricarboxylate transporter [Syntrophobacteraceae bacterium CG2_30_61_12]PIU31471.1 MAG: small permease of tripartite tricarboxylate transporter [Syntrophobacteraceae bacterium CG07_land_8_20_14_0_80_61_8]